MRVQCVPAFFGALKADFFRHHALHYKSFAYCRKNFTRNQLEEDWKCIPVWSSQLFKSKQFAAFHLELNVRDRYGKWDYKQVKNSPFFFWRKKLTEIAPNPPFYWLFTQEYVKKTPRLWLDFSSHDLNERAKFEDVLYGDKHLIEACNQWLNLPLQVEAANNTTLNSAEHSNTETDSEQSSAGWNPPALAGCERILHVGNEMSALNMARIIDFVKTLIDVSERHFSGDLTNF